MSERLDKGSLIYSDEIDDIITALRVRTLLGVILLIMCGLLVIFIFIIIKVQGVADTVPGLIASIPFIIICTIAAIYTIRRSYQDPVRVYENGILLNKKWIPYKNIKFASLYKYHRIDILKIRTKGGQNFYLSQIIHFFWHQAVRDPIELHSCIKYKIK